MIHVITVDGDNVLNMRSFENIDEQDTSGSEMAEKAFAEEVKKRIPENIDAVDVDDFIEKSLEDGYCSVNGYHVYIVHSFAENLQQL